MTRLGFGDDFDLRIVLADSNTVSLLPKLGLQDIPYIMTVPAGDEHKTLGSLQSVWDNLIQFGASRRSLLINVGGGMITDLGGFAASTFKRGMQFVNIPTTLLAMVDASIGGKTGINYGGAKNMIGAFASPLKVELHVELLETLPMRQRLSGFAEMIKHGLLSGPELLNRTMAFDLDKFDLSELKPLIESNIAYKQRVVEADPREASLRKTLNFGHTAGHAFEALLLEKGRPTEHGFCVAWGMVVAAYISVVKLGLASELLTRLNAFVRETYGPLPFDCKAYDRLYELMLEDKKNHDNKILFTLLSEVGNQKTDCEVTRNEIFEAIDFMR